MDELSRVVKVHDLRFLRYVVTDGAYSKQNSSLACGGWSFDQIGKLRADANLRYLYQGPKRPGPGRQRPTMARSTGAPYRAHSIYHTL